MSFNVLFDFGNVLYTFDYGRFFRALAPRAGLSAEGLRVLLFEGNPSASYRFETGAIQPEEFFQWYRREGRIDLPEEEIEKLFIDIFTPHEPGLAVARECGERTRIGLVSNTNKTHADHFMRHSPEYETFSAVVFSCETGAMKPDHSLFRSAIEQLDCRPEDCIFIDDLEENIAGARDFGMVGIHYTPGTDMRAVVAPYLGSG